MGAKEASSVAQDLALQTGGCPKLYKTARKPKAIKVWIVRGENLPSSFADEIDAYVKFSVTQDSEMRIAQTPVVDNDRNPTWNYGCYFFYEGDDDVLQARVWDHNSVLWDDFAASIGRLTIKDLMAYDTEGQGDFDA